MCKSPFVMSVLVVLWLTAGGLSVAAERPASATWAPPAHASGGVGDDDPLTAISGDYNLQIVFATQGSGEYLADVRVLIADAKGNALLEADSPGPLFYVRLPAGVYRVSAAFQGKSLGRSVAVTERRLQTIYFYWPRDAIESEKGRS